MHTSGHWFKVSTQLKEGHFHIVVFLESFKMRYAIPNRTGGLALNSTTFVQSLVQIVVNSFPTEMLLEKSKIAAKGITAVEKYHSR